MTRTIIIILLLLSCLAVRPQYFTKVEGTAMIKELKAAKTDSTRIDLLIKVAEYHTISSYDHPPDFDTAALLLKQAETLNARSKFRELGIQILMAKSYWFRASGKKEDGRNVILNVINILKDGPDYTSLGKAYYALSNYYDQDFKLPTVNTRVGFVEMAIKAFEKSGSLDDLGNCYKVLADLHHLVNEYDKALIEIKTSLAYYQKTGYKNLEGVYDLFGQLHSARGEYKQALTYELMALKIANANYNGGLQVCQIENNVGLTLYKLNDPEAALPHFKNALDIAEKERDFEAVYGLTSHVVEAYIAMQLPGEGLSFLKTIERTVQKPTTDRFETKGYIDKTYLNLYTILKRYDAGRPYCDRLILEKEVAQGRFRLDLYFRINVFPISIPPLRERKQDIKLLSEYFAKQISARFQKEYSGISAEMMEMLQAYPWPGNIRELENTIEQTVILNDVKTPLVLKRPLRSINLEGNAFSETTSSYTGIKTMTDIKNKHTETERDYILAALKKSAGRIRGIGGAATILNLKPTTLESRMVKLGIRREEYSNNSGV